MLRSIGMMLAGMALLAVAPAWAGAEVGFRGDGTGQFEDVKPPLHWAVDSNLVWNTKLKSSNASPIVLKNRIFVCEEPDVLIALNLADGSVLWSATNGYADVLTPAEAQANKYVLPGTHPDNGYATPTPVADRENVYAVYCSGVVVAFTPTGKRLWGRVLPAQPHNRDFGHSASPRLADGVLLVHYGNKLFALDARTGADKWTADAGSGFGTPVVTRCGGASAVVTPGGEIFAVRDGRRLASGMFRFPWNGPVVRDGVVYKVDEDGAAAHPLPKDGSSQTGGLWTAKVPGGRYYATSVVHGGLVYNINQGGTLVVLDAADGAVVYEKALGLGGTVYPSPTLAGGRLYISSDTGMTVVLAPGRIYEELARNRLPPFRSSPLFVGDSLLVRTTSGLCRVREK